MYFLNVDTRRKHISSLNRRELLASIENNSNLPRVHTLLRKATQR